tara:strand:- start:897 stop:1226 length:330 start_codon:yes stop_codon:yes gene_type:complete
MITITDKAIAKAKDLKVTLNKPANYALNVKLNSGGCSGFMYDIEFIESPPEDTHRLFEHDGLTVSCDKKSYIFLIGTEIDWQESLMSTGFKIYTPAATGRCGCGESVSF